jgi:hypothetical protein
MLGRPPSCPSHHIFGFPEPICHHVHLILRPVVRLGTAVRRLVGGLIAKVILEVPLVFRLPLGSVGLGFLDHKLQPFVLFDFLKLFP